MRRLPSIQELLAFESVARHLSFTKAAAELCITQSAVSHRVHRLEKHFGTQLIHRLNPGLTLTDAGTALLPELIMVLNGLEKLGGKRERRLRVAAGNALCTWWLARRLPAFMQDRPDLSIDLLPIENDARFIPQVDVRILWVGEQEEDATGVAQTPLFSEQVFPVCSPRLLPQRCTRDWRALQKMTLLHKAADSAGEWSWRNWFDRMGLDYSERRGGELRFADMGLLLSAAVDGGGVALARSLLAHDALQDRRLIVPIGGFEPAISSKKHVARWPRAQAEDPDIRSFVTWLAREARTTLDETEQFLRQSSAQRPGARSPDS